MNDAPTSRPGFDRAAEDLGNIVELGHVNVAVPDQLAATRFYITGLGLTRDPYMMTGTDNMWANVGRSQFHLPTGGPQILRGRIGLALPDPAGLRARLEGLRAGFAGTSFALAEAGEALDVTCPWGNRFRCHAPVPGMSDLGMHYVEVAVPPGSAAGIARFYREVLGARASCTDGCARIVMGEAQTLICQETDAPVPPFDGHHIQITLADFSGPHRRLAEHGLITEESNRHQYRFQDVIDPASGAVLFTLEHEVRSMTHPMYGRALINRNAGQTARGYRRGRDAWSPPAG